MATDTQIPIGTDGALQKKVRTIAAEVLQPDGSTATVNMQVVSVMDEEGRPYSENAGLPTSDQSTHELLVRIADALDLLTLKLTE